jgi:hypothetical protein
MATRRTKKKSLYVPTLLLALLGAADTMGGCADDGPSLNPQPLPPQPPDDDRKNEEAQGPGGFGGGSVGGADASESPSAPCLRRTPVGDAGQ